MAIIGNLNKLEVFFSDFQLLDLFNYLKESLNDNTSINKRLVNLEVGSFKKDITIQECIVFHQSAITKKRYECFIESHKKFVDFQLIVNGSEQMEYVDIDKLKKKEMYNPDKDLIIYDDYEHTSKFLLQKSDIAIFFPDDAHIGQSMYIKESLINKVVVKVPVEIFNTKKR